MLWLMIPVFLIILGGSLWLKITFYRNQLKGMDTKSSPLSLAVQDLVSTAGGIYLAIITLTSFLKLDTPEKVSLLNATVDPLALFAIVLAIIQPFIVKLINKLLK